MNLGYIFPYLDFRSKDCADSKIVDKQTFTNAGIEDVSKSYGHGNIEPQDFDVSSLTRKCKGKVVYWSNTRSLMIIGMKGE